MNPVIAERQKEVEALYSEQFGEPDEEGEILDPQPVPLPDDALLKRARSAANGESFSTLFDDGDYSGYGSQSEADLALCGMLAFWTGGEPERIDRLFRESGRCRPKWSKRRGQQTYGERTITEALRGKTDFYSVAGSKPEVSTDPISDSISQAGDGNLLLWRRDLDSLPTLEWLVEGVIPKDSSGVLVGPFASGKTFVLVDIAACVATGTAWHGLEVAQGPVLYVYSEGVRGAKQRVEAWESANGKTAPDIAFIPRPVHLLDRDEVDYVLKRINEEMPEPPVLIIIDTLSRSIAGADENSQKDMTIAVENAALIGRETGAAVWFAHHPNRGGDYRGSSVLPGAVDVMASVKKAEDIVTISCEKMKDAPPFDDITLVLMPHEGSLALETETTFNMQMRKIDSMKEEEWMVLAALAAFGEEGASYSQWRTAAGMPKTTFNRHRNALKGAGVAEQRGKRWYQNTLAETGGLGPSHGMEPSARSHEVPTLLRDGEGNPDKGFQDTGPIGPIESQSTLGLDGD